MRLCGGQPVKEARRSTRRDVLEKTGKAIAAAPICFLKRYDVQDTIVKKESTYFFRVSFLIVCLKNVAFDFLGAAE